MKIYIYYLYVYILSCKGCVISTQPFYLNNFKNICKIIYIIIILLCSLYNVICLKKRFQKRILYWRILIMEFYHVSMDVSLEKEKEFVPRIPLYRCEGENSTIPRICVCRKLEEAISAFPYKSIFC